MLSKTTRTTIGKGGTKVNRISANNGNPQMPKKNMEKGNGTTKVPAIPSSAKNTFMGS